MLVVKTLIGVQTVLKIVHLVVESREMLNSLVDVIKKMAGALVVGAMLTTGAKRSLMAK